MEIFSDLFRTAKGAVGSALEKSQSGVVYSKASNMLPKAIEQSFYNMDPVLQMELAGALKEIVDSFDGENARKLDWPRLMQNPGTKALLSEVVKHMVKSFVPKV